MDNEGNLPRFQKNFESKIGVKRDHEAAKGLDESYRQRSVIAAQFEASKIPVSMLKHPTRPDLHAVEARPILPDLDLWENEYLLPMLWKLTSTDIQKLYLKPIRFRRRLKRNEINLGSRLYSRDLLWEKMKT